MSLRSELAAPTPRDREATHTPGETGIWVLIASELAVFTVFFVSLAVDRLRFPGDFSAGSAELSQAFGVLNTVVLLTSSLFVVLGVRAYRRSRPALAARWFLAGVVCGLVFTIDKAFEYGHELNAGFAPSHDRFFNYYYALTGLHLVHVLLGMIVLGGLAASMRRSPGPHRLAYVEGGACFWHLVDLIWLILFPLLYLVR